MPALGFVKNQLQGIEVLGTEVATKNLLLEESAFLSAAGLGHQLLKLLRQGTQEAWARTEV